MPDNTFYLDDIFAGVGVASEKKLGLVPIHSSTTYDSHALKLGLVQSSVLGPFGLVHELKLGFVPSHTSDLYGAQTLKLGLIPSHSSVVYGTLLKKLGFALSYGLTNIFYLDDIFGALGVASEKKLGLVPLHISELRSTELIKLGFVQSSVLGPLGLLCELKLGFVPSHSSTTFGSHALKLGFTPSHTSIIYGILLKKIGFIPIHEAKVYKFIVELKFYDRDDNLVRIISSKTQNFPLINPGLEFEFLQDGGCGFFGFTTSEDLSLDYNYKCEIYLYEEKWFTGYITKLPKIGTKATYEYRGWGFWEQANWQTIKETYIGDELSVVTEDILDNYIIGKTDIKKAA